MLKKIMVVSGAALYSFSSLGAEVRKIDSNWQLFGVPFRITTETVNDENFDKKKVTTFNEIVMDYHKRDSKNNEDYLTFYQSLLQSHSDHFLNGKNELLLIYKKDEIVGGTYVSIEEEGKTIRMSAAGYKDVELVYAQKRMIDSLSAKNFPGAQRLVVFLPNNHPNISKLGMFGFRISDYTVSDHPADQYTCLQKG